MSNNDTEISQLPRIWAETANAGDVDAMISLYSEEAVFWGTTLNQLVHGLKGIRAYFDAVFHQYPGLHTEVKQVAAQAMGDTATTAGSVEIVNIVDGVQQSAGKARFSFTYRRTDGQWKIMQHHSSLMP